MDWDLAVVQGLGGVHDDVENQWYLPLDVYIDDPFSPSAVEKALMVNKRPEPTQVEMDVPEIAIFCDDRAPDASRLLGSGTTQYRLPAEGSTPVSVYGQIGYNYYETKEQERPYDLVYSVETWARYRPVALMLLQHVLARFPLRGTINIVDGRGVERTYLVTQEAVADLTEVRSMVDRLVGFSVTLRIEAEVTLDREPVCVPGFTGPTTPDPGDLPPWNPDFPGGNPGLPGDGLYGSGLADIRATLLED